MEKSGVVRRMFSTSLWMVCARRRSPWIRQIPCGVMRIAPLPMRLPFTQSGTRTSTPSVWLRLRL
eukprot:4188278-Lingulodinium_polyedra.AAC.1